MSAADLIGRTFSPPRFAVDGLLPEGLTILGGRPKQGKSWFSLLLGWAVAGTYEVDGRGGMPGPVLYLALEDTERRLQNRLATLGGGLGWKAPERFTLNTAWPRSPDGLYYLAEWLDAHKADDFKLVIVDTLAKWRAPQRGAGNSYAEDYEAIGPLKQLLDHYRASGLVVHHTRKLRAEDPFDELSGTLGISGAADTLWVLDRERGSDAANLYVTGRDVADSTVPMTWHKDHCRWAVGTTRDGIDTGDRTVADPTGNKAQQCAAWLRDFLRVFAHPSKEIESAAKAAGYGFAALRDAKAALGKQGTGEVVNVKFGMGEWWSGLGPRLAWKLRPGRVPEGSDTSESSSQHWTNGKDSQEIPD